MGVFSITVKEFLEAMHFDCSMSIPCIGIAIHGKESVMDSEIKDIYCTENSFFIRTKEKGPAA